MTPGLVVFQQEAKSRPVPVPCLHRDGDRGESLEERRAIGLVLPPAQPRTFVDDLVHALAMRPAEGPAQPFRRVEAAQKFTEGVAERHPEIVGLHLGEFPEFQTRGLGLVLHPAERLGREPIGRAVTAADDRSSSILSAAPRREW